MAAQGLLTADAKKPVMFGLQSMCYATESEPIFLFMLASLLTKIIEIYHNYSSDV